MTHVRHNTAIGDAILAAAKAEGGTIAGVKVSPPKPKRKKQTVVRTRKNERQKGNIQKRVGIGWEHPLSTLTISVDEGNCDEVHADGPYTWARVKFDDYRPKRLNVRFNTKGTSNNTLTYMVFGEDRIKRIDGDLPSLYLDVSWDKFGVPSVRQKHEDNCDVIFMDDQGRFAQLMVGVVVRSWWKGKGKKGWALYLYLQEQFTGQVVRTTKAKAQDLNLTYVEHNGVTATVIPLFDYHAYPDVDWLSIVGSAKFGKNILVPTALDEGRSVPLSRAHGEVWNPPALGEPSQEGRKRGVVLWYNIAWNGGSGFIHMEDGNNIFFHWTGLKDTFAAQPMSIVEFTSGEHNGKAQAKNVQVVNDLEDDESVELEEPVKA